MKKFSYQDATKFHGHSCPGLAMGYRAAESALKQFGRDKDEEIFAVVENDSCSVDAVQALCSCTFGKGNLLFLDRGKQVFTFFARRTGKGLRIYVSPPELSEADQNLQKELSAIKNPSAAQKRKLHLLCEKRIHLILNAPEKTVLKISRPRVKLPDMAKIRTSGYCSVCGERTMETRLLRKRGKQACIECAGKR